MDLMEKVGILTEAAKYDVSCSSSGNDRSNPGGKLGNAVAGGICHSFAVDGRCISLLKILFSNHCIFDCRYCRNRRTNDIPRASFTVEELTDLTMGMYRRNYIEGLFLSSGVLGDPDKTMQLMFRVVEKLREERGFNGYIHMKAIPGAHPGIIRRAGLLVDRMSVNIELPSAESLARLAPQKSRTGILQPMALIGNTWEQTRRDRPKIRSTPNFIPAGHSTQIIIGASPESDFQIIHLMEYLYRRFFLKRVYYSAFVPVVPDTTLPTLSTPPLLREHRLYQADWLLRFYRYHADEIIDPDHPFLDEQLDPKASWALRHFDFFPVEVNRASYDVLLRVPGIGPNSARKIIGARKRNTLDFDHLGQMRVVLKRAQYFITCRGRLRDRFILEPERVRSSLLPEKPAESLQLSLFP